MASTWALSVPASVSSPPHPPISSIELLDRVVLPRGLTFHDTLVGGLSGLAFDVTSQEIWALSDDRAETGPVRIYSLRMDFAEEDDTSPGRKVSVTVDGMVALSDLDGRSFAPRSIDPEGLALLGGSFLFSTEAITAAGTAPLIAQVGADGRVVRELPLPARVVPGPGRGGRNNLGFESLAISPDGRYLFAGLENALIQDGPEAGVGVGSLSRIMRFDLQTGLARQEFVYPVDPVTATPSGPGALVVNGLVDLLPVDRERLLALERGYADGVGAWVRLYSLSLTGATDVAPMESLAETGAVPASKVLLLDFASLGIPQDNFEGMTFGPTLADGRRSLIIVSDDNFNPAQEPSTFLVFAVDVAPLTIAGVQGPGHRSPVEGRWVAGIDGVITAVDPNPRSAGFWLESPKPDGDPRTSEGLFARWADVASLAPGQAVRLSGRVEENAQAGGLPVTSLRVVSVLPMPDPPALPPPLKLFSDLPMPAVIDDDALAEFDPQNDAIDRWESLEGMRVELPGGTVIGPTARYGELVLRPNGAGSDRRTAAGGTLLDPSGASQRRVFLARRLTGEIPELDVGAEIAGPIAGIVDYSFSNYKVLPLRPLRVMSGGDACDDQTALAGDRSHVTLATFNVENLSAAGEADRFQHLGEVIARRLHAPDLVALEEVQDDSGPAKGDGIVTCQETLARLTTAIAAAGGPRYEGVWIDPVPDREGGQPGGNIRVAMLVNPRRLKLVGRGAGGSMDATEPSMSYRELELTLSPGRVVPTSPAFSLAEGEGVRRSLAVQLRFRGQTIFVIANHWSSKFDDDRPYGATQPPRTPTAAKRLAQAEAIRAFVQRLLDLDPDARVVVLGDLNDFEFSAPVTTLAAPPLMNLILRVPESERYTFNFEGSSQILDHVVVTPALAPDAEIQIVHCNADCSAGKRTSDHDPVVVRLPMSP